MPIDAVIQLSVMSSESCQWTWFGFVQADTRSADESIFCLSEINASRRQNVRRLAGCGVCDVLLTDAFVFSAFGFAVFDFCSPPAGLLFQNFGWGAVALRRGGEWIGDAYFCAGMDDAGGGF